jgi:hypothetical protein
MKTIQNLILSTLFLCCLTTANNVLAQCGAGEVEVTFEFHTDAYGYESYWELVPGGNACGNGIVVLVVHRLRLVQVMATAMPKR